jgi:hypothetical protein
MQNRCKSCDIILDASCWKCGEAICSDCFEDKCLECSKIEKDEKIKIYKEAKRLLDSAKARFKNLEKGIDAFSKKIKKYKS